jgi:hypothetical protein
MAEVRQKLLDALRAKALPNGVIILEPSHCSAAGCRVDVQYANYQAFVDFEEGKFHSPGSPFEEWRWGNGRTGLLQTQDNRLIATWFFLAKHPVSGKYGSDK